MDAGQTFSSKTLCVRKAESGDGKMSGAITTADKIVHSHCTCIYKPSFIWHKSNLSCFTEEIKRGFNEQTPDIIKSGNLKRNEWIN